MTGVLYARWPLGVGGTWVPILANALPAGGAPGYVLSLDASGNAIWLPAVSAPPTYVGPRRDVAPDQAQFGHIGDPGSSQGFIVPGSGDLYAMVEAGRTFTVWSEPVGGGGETQIASIESVRAVFGQASVSAMALGQHPIHGSGFAGLWSEWSRGNVNGSDYALLVGTGGSAGQTLLNGWSSLDLRVSNAGRISLNTSDTTIGAPNNTNVRGENYLGLVGVNKIWMNSAAMCALQLAGVDRFTVSSRCNTNEIGYTSTIADTGDWGNAHVLAYAHSFRPHIAWHTPGYAAMWRMYPANGQTLEAVNADSSAYNHVNAQQFNTMSTETIKRDIRTLRPDYDRPFLDLDPWSDTVVVPDIMPLRVVAWRPKEPNRKLVPAPGHDEYTTERETWDYVPEDPDSVFGIEGNRERIGLIAEEVERVVPSAVVHNIDGDALGIDYAQITVALLDHVQQLTRTVETLQYRITELEAAHG